MHAVAFLGFCAMLAAGPACAVRGEAIGTRIVIVNDDTSTQVQCTVRARPSHRHRAELPPWLLRALGRYRRVRLYRIFPLPPHPLPTYHPVVVGGFDAA